MSKKFQLDENTGSIMIIVPHEDDEILIAAGVIAEAVRQKIPVKVVMVTNGDYESKDGKKGLARLQESINGLNVLGAPEQDFVALGYADTGMPENESFLMKLYREADGEAVVTSMHGSYTYGLQDHVEYHRQKYGEAAPYCKNSVFSDLEELLREEQPDNIITTSEFDTHGDHAGLFFIVRDLLNKLRQDIGYQPHLYCGIVHSLDGDDAWPTAGARFTEPVSMERRTTYRWQDRLVFELTDPEKKKQALAVHRTALEPNAIAFLYSFCKAEEIFWKLQ